jgi:predicted DNA-binding transcriptional regulator AlpA
VSEFITTAQLAERWGIPIRTLENYRYSKRTKGPAYHRIGGDVRYKMSDIEEYEKAHKKHTKEVKE